MGEVTWLEVLGRHRDVVSRHRIEGGGLAIGRAYDNDVILDDPAVAPRHLRIARDADGRWLAEDLGSVNGLHVEGGKARVDRAVLEGETVLRIGRTLLRARRDDFPVAPEEPLSRGAPTWPVAGALALATLAVTLLQVWLSEVTASQLSTYVNALSGIAAALIAWTGLWSLACRVFAGRAWFERHLCVALAGYLAYVAIGRLWNLAAFSLGVPMPAFAVTASQWAVVAAIAYGHLRVIGPRHLPLKAGAVTGIAVAALGMGYVSQREAEIQSGRVPVPMKLMPPALRLAPGRAEDAFFARAGERRGALEKARAEDVTGHPGNMIHVSE